MAHMSALETVWLLILRQVMEYISRRQHAKGSNSAHWWMKFLSAVPRRAVLNQSVHLDSVNTTVLECKQVPPQQHIASVKRPPRWEWPLRASFAFRDIVGEKEKKKILIIPSHISCQKDKHVETPECQTLWQSYKSVTIKKNTIVFFFLLFNSFCKWLCVLNRGKRNELSSCRTQKSAFSPSVASKSMPLCVLCVQSKYENLLQFNLLILKGMNVDFVHILLNIRGKLDGEWCKKNKTNCYLWAAEPSLSKPPPCSSFSMKEKKTTSSTFSFYEQNVSEPCTQHAESSFVIHF